MLMGRRGAKAAFMPSKHVFPGGAVDPGDAGVPLDLPPGLRDALAERPDPGPASPVALAAAAIRELWEESGLRLAVRGPWPDPPAAWASFAAGGWRPDAATLRFVFRAVTPPGRPRRFDARFLLAPAEAVAGDPDDFSAASDELSALEWVPLAEAAARDVPFVTEIALAEIARHADGRPPAAVPFLDNGAEASLFHRLRGRPQGVGE